MDDLVAEQTLSRNSTTLFLNESMSGESFSQRLFQTALLFDGICTPLLCLFGILGNSLSLVVFSTDPTYKNQSASLYLSALAITDTGYLLTLLVVWLEGVLDEGGLITSSNFSCSLFMYLGQVTCFLSVYLTVAFTIERYVAVRSPLSKGRTFTRTKAKRCVAVLSIIALIICSYAWLIAEVIKYPLASPQQQPQATTPSTPQSRKNLNDSSESENSSVVVMLAMAMIVQDRSRSHDVHQTTSDDYAWGEIQNSGPHVLNHELVMNGTQEYDHDSIIPDIPADDSNDQDYDYICSVPEAFYKISEIANYCDTIITFLIPFLLITYFNIQIATCVWKLKTQRRSMIATISRNSCHDSNSGRCSSFNSGFTIAQQLPKKQQQSNNDNDNSPEIHVTKTLLLVSSVFLVLNLPSHLIRCAMFIQNLTGFHEGQEMLQALQPWANILFNTNFAVNFLLYCVSGKRFRASLYNLLSSAFWRRKFLYHHRHQAGNVIKASLNRSFLSPLRSNLTTTEVMKTRRLKEKFVCIEMGNGNESITGEKNGLVKSPPVDEILLGTEMME